MSPYIIGLIKKQKKISEQIEAFKAKCGHIHCNKKDGGDSGNFDPMDDLYWTDYECLHCGETWRDYHK